jgi:hypothetical protein
MKNKFIDNDPRLTAYALGELPREEAEEVARMLDAPLNGPLQRKVEGIDALGVMLTQTLHLGGAEEINLKLSPSHRDAIFRSAKAPTADDVSSTHQSAWLRPMLVTLGAAAVVTLSLMVLNNVDSGEERTAEVSSTALPADDLQAPIQPSDADWDDLGNGASSVSSQGVHNASHAMESKGVSINDNTEKLLELVENDWVERADKAVTRMPLACGKASWNWVKHRINVDGVLPDKNAVRVEEILNTFSYDEPSDLELSFVTSSVELVQCPWDVERQIAVILVKNKHTESIQIESAVTFSESVEKYRLVGYAKAELTEENSIAPAKITLGAGDSHIVIYEIETITDIKTAADVLSLNIRTEIKSKDTDEWISEDETLNVQFSDRSWTKAKQDVKFALMIADWCRVISTSDHPADNGSASIAEMINHFENTHTPTDQQAVAIKVLKKGLNLL